MNQTAPETGTKRERGTVVSPSKGIHLYAVSEGKGPRVAAENRTAPGERKISDAASRLLLAREESRALTENRGRGLSAENFFCASSIFEARICNNDNAHCSMRGSFSAANALVTRVWRSVKGFLNDQLLRSGKGIFSGEKLSATQGQKNHSPKNFSPAVKFSLQENESDYKVFRDNPKAKRFVETGVLLLFQETT